MPTIISINSKKINKVAYPLDFDFRPFEIYEQQGFFYPNKSNKDIVAEKISKLKPYFLDFENGSNTNNGESELTAFKTLSYAFSQGARLIYFRAGDTVQASGFGTLLGSAFSNEDIFLISKGESYTNVINNFENPIFSLESGSTYQATFTGTINNVIDMKFVNEFNLPLNLEEVATLGEVNSTPNTYTIISNTIYCHLKDSRVPDSKLFLSKISNSTGFRVNSGNVYMEGLRFVGGDISFRFYGTSTTLAVSTANILMNDCQFMYGRSNGFSFLQAGGLSWMENCLAFKNKLDGFSYSQGAAYTTSKNIEVNCISFQNGYKNTVSKCNGSSAHNKHTIIRVGGKYYQNIGPNIIDVSGAKSFNVGVNAFESLGFEDVDTGGDKNWSNFGDFAVGTVSTENPTKMWLYGCVSQDSALSYATPEFLSNDTTPDDSVIYVNNGYNVAPFENNVVFDDFVVGSVENIYIPITLQSFAPKEISVKATLNFPSTASGTESELTVSVVGASVGDRLICGFPVVSSGSIYSAFISSADTITVRLYVYGGSTVDPGSSVFSFTVLK